VGCSNRLKSCVYVQAAHECAVGVMSCAIVCDGVCDGDVCVRWCAMVSEFYGSFHFAVGVRTGCCNHDCTIEVPSSITGQLYCILCFKERVRWELGQATLSLVFSCGVHVLMLVTTKVPLSVRTPPLTILSHPFVAFTTHKAESLDTLMDQRMRPTHE